MGDAFFVNRLRAAVAVQVEDDFALPFEDGVLRSGGSVDEDGEGESGRFGRGQVEAAADDERGGDDGSAEFNGSAVRLPLEEGHGPENAEEEARDGDQTARVRLPGVSEMAALGRVFDEMADATEQSERQIREAADLLNALIESSADAIFVKDRDGRYIVSNTTFAFPPSFCTI